MCSTMVGIPAMDIPLDPTLSDEVERNQPAAAVPPPPSRLSTVQQLPVASRPPEINRVSASHKPVPGTSANLPPIPGKVPPASGISPSVPATPPPVPNSSSSRILPAVPQKTADNSDVREAVPHPSSVFKGIKMSAVPSLTSAREDIDVSAISNSTILPCVDVDKSFDMPVFDQLNALAAAENTSVRKREITTTRHRIDVTRATPTESINLKADKTGVIDLSNIPDAARPREDAATIRRLQKAFIQAQLFDDRRFRILGRLINFRSLDYARDVDVLMSYLSSTYQKESPVIVQLCSSCDFGRENVLRAFLQRCNKELEQFRTYAEVYSADGSGCDLVTAMLASRIALFPHEEEMHKISRLISVVEESLNLEDRRWGLDILFVRYGLRQYVSARLDADVSSLIDRNESDLIELLENMIIHDAAQGPVVLIFSLNNTEKQTVWRDLVFRLKHVPVSNVLILLNGGSPLTEMESLEIATHEVSPLTDRDCMLILNQLLPYLSQDELMHLTAKCGGNLTQLKRVMRIFQRQNPFENTNSSNEIDILKFIDSLPDNATALSHTYYHSFTAEECRFLSVASILGGRFYLNDLTTILSLEPLPDEIPGFRDLRGNWCEHVASKLMESGEIFMIHQSEKRGIRFEFPEYKLFEFISNSMDCISAQRLHGCFARILERDGAPETTIALQYEAADMWPEAATHWLSIAKRYNRNFYDQTSYTILRTCLQHIGPQYDEIYPALLRECIALCHHIGRYADICFYAGQLTRIGRMFMDMRCMIKAFIDMAEAFRVQGDILRAREMAQYGLDLAEKIADETLISLANHTMAKIIFESGAKGSLVNALRYAEKALETRRHLGDLVAISHTQTLCSRIYLRRGEPSRAKTAANEAYHALMASGHWYETPIALTSLAKSTSALQEAMLDDYLERGFAIIEKTGEVEHHFELLTARLLLTINSSSKQAIRADLNEMRRLIKSCPVPSWIATYHLLNAMFDFSRKNFQKTTKALRCFFEAAQKLDNGYIMAMGYALSAELNFEVYLRNLSPVSLEKTEKLYVSATTLFESVGAWHEVARSLRLYANFLNSMNRPDEAENSRKRADKVDPYK